MDAGLRFALAAQQVRHVLTGVVLRDRVYYRNNGLFDGLLTAFGEHKSTVHLWVPAMLRPRMHVQLATHPQTSARGLRERQHGHRVHARVPLLEHAYRPVS